jgi:hypothetical protein
MSKYISFCDLFVDPYLNIKKQFVYEQVKKVDLFKKIYFK